MSPTDPIGRTRARIAGSCALACLAYTLWTWIDHGSAQRLPLGQPFALASVVAAALLVATGTALAVRPVRLPAPGRRALVLSFSPVCGWLLLYALRLLLDPVGPGDKATGLALAAAVTALLVTAGCVGRIPPTGKSE
ncbi:hypothetical protein ACWGB8_05280 [Kitasatospora sp. NPDC054939]